MHCTLPSGHPVTDGLRESPVQRVVGVTNENVTAWNMMAHIRGHGVILLVRVRGGRWGQRLVICQQSLTYTSWQWRHRTVSQS